MPNGQVDLRQLFFRFFFESLQFTKAAFILSKIQKK